MSKKLIDRTEIRTLPKEEKRLRIFEEVWRGEDGKETTRRKYSLPDFVQVLALTPEGRVIGISEFQSGVGATYVKLVSGDIEPGETPEAAAQRELFEETGYRAGRVEFLTSILENSGWSDRRVHFLVAYDCEKSGEGEGEIETRLFEPQELWRCMVNYFFTNPRGKHGGGNSLKLLVLAKEVGWISF